MGCLFPSLLLLVLSAFSPSLAQPWDGVVITQADYQGLQAFKRALVDRRGFLKSWNDSGDGACSGGWEGIKCAQGQVISIQLPWRGLGGRISEGISQLTALRKLNLHDNLLQGPVPQTLGFLPNLRGVYLFNNRLSGSIPPSIGRSPLLQTLDLSRNSLSGPIPLAIASSAKLYRLNLSFNNLSGEIPAGIAQSPSLTFLSLHGNLLSGAIPDSWGGSGGHRLQTLALDDNYFSGGLPPSIGKLQGLQIFTISNNRINGSIPEEFGDLAAIVQLNLAGNLISGEIPATIGRLKNISLLSLKRNKLQGSIPAALGNISGISFLDLSDNNFTGEIPASLGGLSNLSFFNVSDNDLSGQVPPLLSKKFNSSSFSRNLLLCGFNGSAPCSPPPILPPAISETPAATANTRRTRKLSLKDIVLIVIGSILLVLLILCCVLLVCLIKKRKELKNSAASASRGEKSTGTSGGGPDVDSGGDAGGKLVHFDGPLIFTADDLLCATAEIMGKSTYGTVYKATLEDGNQVAVKRLREKIAKNQREFEAEVNALGKIRHPNLLSLRAYYLGPKGEKLLVFDFMPKGSLAAFLHARGPDTPVDWATRMNIMVGAARGLHHLHTKENTVHGNLTSGNILLDEEVNAKIADYGLSKLMSAAANSNVIATAGALGYRAPELSKLKKASVKTDVYSLGVVMLELLTGKSPGEAMNGVDLPQRVASIVKEEWTNEVFDLELMRDAEGSTGDELLNTLKLALHCVDPSPAARPEVNQVLRQLEEVKPELAGGDAAGSSAEKVVGDDGEEDPVPGSTSPPTVEEVQK